MCMEQKKKLAKYFTTYLFLEVFWYDNSVAASREAETTEYTK